MIMPRRLILVFMAVGVLTLLILRLDFLHEKVFVTEEENSDEIFITEDGLLFRQLMDARIIFPFSGDDDRLVLPETDQELVEKAALEQAAGLSKEQKTATKKRINLLKGLFHTSSGNAVLTQVRLWNQAHLIAAVRDNRKHLGPAKINFWKAFEPGPLNLPLTSGQYVPESYGFVNNGELRPGFGNWRAVSSHIEGEVVFTTLITLEKPGDIIVQGIGTFVESQPEVSPSLFCGKTITCSVENARAFALTISLPSGKHHLKMSVKPVSARQNTIPGLNISKSNNTYTWKKLHRSGPVLKKSFTISSFDGIELAAASGAPTAFAETAGLVPLLGVGKHDTYALSGILARSRLPSDLTNIALTIDSRLQARAQQVLQEKLSTFFPASRDKYTDIRKGAVIILDADTGAILAAAGTPIPPPDTHPWDIVSFARTYPLKNPMVLRAWKGLDKHNAPGSCFKPVVALAALDEYDKNQAVKKFIKGYSKKELLKKNNSSGLFYNTSAYSPINGKCYTARKIPGQGVRKITNFKRKSIGVLIEKKISLVCDQEEPRLAMGLDEAIRESVNVWFTRLAMIMDAEKATLYDRAMVQRKKGDLMPVFPDFRLAKTAALLGFENEPFDLAFNLPEDIILRRWPYREKTSQGDVLFAVPGSINLMNRDEGGFLWILAQNAIGQGMVTSPVQIARVAASIATGRIRSPYLFSSINSISVKPDPGKTFNFKEKRLKLLQHAMKKVPTIGTAKTAFKKHPNQCRIYGKTGTANVAVVEKGSTKNQKTFFTTWFMGWQEPENKGEKRLAFACMVTHAHGRYYTGGAVCAPIVAEILKDF
jgi:cell division protein FtsI/penicillin-binding protein 2